ncbi:MAG: DUF4386 domain-containing protein, partial [Gaiellaceae bacterium]
LAVGVLFILTFITSIGAVFAYGSVLSDPNYITGAGADGRVFLGAFLELMLILTFVTSIAGVMAYGPVLSDPNYITSAGADTRVFVGAFLELMLIVTNIGCATVLYPILKRQNEGLAIAYVAARIVECTFILIGLLSVLTVVTLRQTATATDAGSILTIGKTLHAIHDWTFLLGPGFTDGIGTGLILGYLMYRSGLVPRPATWLGLIGGPLIIVSGTAVMFTGNNPSDALHSLQGIMSAPEILWELFLGIYCTFWGFRRDAPILSGSAG